MKTKLLAACALGAMALASAANAADDFKPKTAGTIMLNVRVSQVDPVAGDPITTLAGAATGLTAEVDADTVPSIGLTYFFTDNVAVEVIAATSKHHIVANTGVVNVPVKDTWVLPPVVSLQYHFQPDQRVSPYLGAGLNYMLFYNGTDQGPYRLDVDSGFGYSLQAGVDIATQGAWSVNLDAKKVFFTTDAVDTTNSIKSRVKLDPWVLSAGLGYKF